MPSRLFYPELAGHQRQPRLLGRPGGCPPINNKHGFLYHFSLQPSDGRSCHSPAPLSGIFLLSVKTRIRPVFNFIFRTRVRAFEGIRLVTGFKKIDHVLVRMRDRKCSRHLRTLFVANNRLLRSSFA